MENKCVPVVDNDLKIAMPDETLSGFKTYCGVSNIYNCSGNNHNGDIELAKN